MQAMDTWQILVLGEAGVGKSSLSTQFALDYFPVRRESDACMLVFSITCRGSFGSAARFHEQVKALKEGDLPFVLIGNKSDLSDNREVSKEEGAALAKQFGCQYIETSAQTAQNVEHAVAGLVRALR
ncbi:P-loop containing nucleoside triphosphate hydrolase protein [Mycena leptocephala]|nr:P-loop containing nucleoside triphosphate hydrolase protein [Mycena leptocephala]